MPLGEKAKKFYNDNFANKTESKEEKAFDIKNTRKAVEESFSKWLANVSIPKTINVSNERLEFKNQNHIVKATIYTPAEAKGPLPVVIFNPGGGLALDMAHHHAHICAMLAQSAAAAVVCIQPELSPEKRLPEIVEACYAGTKHFYSQAKKYNFDPAQMSLSGYSMGGTVAALIALRARTEANLKFQSLLFISGVFDLGNPPVKQGEDFMFDPATHKKFVELCLPDGKTISAIKDDPLCSPLAANLHGLPKTFLVAGECDVFKADTEKMAKKLKESGVAVTTTIIPGQIHNTLLLYPVMGDNQNPAEVAGAYVKSLAHDLFNKVDNEHKNKITCRLL
jgi:acetyl esterase